MPLNDTENVKTNDFISILGNQFCVPPLAIGYQNIHNECKNPSLQGLCVQNNTSVLSGDMIRYHPFKKPLCINSIVKLNDCDFLLLKKTNQTKCNMRGKWEECSEIKDNLHFMNEIITPSVKKTQIEFKWQVQMFGLRINKEFNDNRLSLFFMSRL